MVHNDNTEKQLSTNSNQTYEQRPVLSIITPLPTILGAERLQAAADGADVLLL